MKILLALASDREYNLLLENLSNDALFASLESSFQYGNIEILLLRHGTGMLFTCYHLQQYLLSHEIDLAFQLGIAGSMPSESIGDARIVASEELGDMGVYENGYFKSIFDLGLENPDKSPFVNGMLYSEMPEEYWGEYPKSSSITVNSLLDDPEWSEARLENMDAQLENMEGAAFYYVTKMLCIPSLEIRGISNHVGVRDKSLWQIDQAMEASIELWKKILKKILDE